MTDVIVVGGGVIGLSVAYELAGQGTAVKILDRGPFGQEASWAGAGMLPPGNPHFAQSPEARLRAESHVLWPSLSQRLKEETGVDNGFRKTGALRVSWNEPAENLRQEIRHWREEGVEVEELARSRLFDHEPALNSEITDGYRLPELCQVRNPRHLKALVAGCAAWGVELLPNKPVTEFEHSGEKISAVRTADGDYYTAGKFVVTAGPWSQRLLAAAGVNLQVEPIRGQIVLLEMQPLPFRHVVEVGPNYLVPRPDGRILIGATEERAGYEKRNTAGGVTGLLQLATELVPSLSQAAYARCWAGLRPKSVDGLPYLGRVPESENLYVASGHFRAGLQMSPITGLLMRQLLLEQELRLPLDAFACDRRQNEEPIPAK